jgi:hypothetical protein
VAQQTPYLVLQKHALSTNNSKTLTKQEFLIKNLLTTKACRNKFNTNEQTVYAIHYRQEVWRKGLRKTACNLLIRLFPSAKKLENSKNKQREVFSGSLDQLNAHEAKDHGYFTTR